MDLKKLFLVLFYLVLTISATRLPAMGNEKSSRNPGDFNDLNPFNCATTQKNEPSTSNKQNGKEITGSGNIYPDLENKKVADNVRNILAANILDGTLVMLPWFLLRFIFPQTTHNAFRQFYCTLGNQGGILCSAGITPALLLRTWLFQNGTARKRMQNSIGSILGFGLTCLLAKTIARS
ncbi:MAG: hypothetical protein JW725_04750 [Candidatus Babeliaceae bacterium]|nr:hypothetical protein [Candidatus Babeliaceae bacterium]